MNVKLQRQCASCRSYKSRDNFVRLTFVRNLNEIVLNAGQYFGRSLYLCSENNCLKAYANIKKIRGYFARAKKNKTQSFNPVIKDTLLNNLI